MKKRKSFAALIMFMCLLVTAVPVTVSAKDMKLAFNAETSGTGNAIQVRSVEYDSSDTKNGMAELEVKFSTRVQWKKSSAVTSIKDNTGNTYDGWIKDRDDDDCEIAIENLKAGRTYTIKIKGIKVRGTNGYRTLTLSGVKIPKGSSELRVESVEYDEDYDDDYDYGETAYKVEFSFNKDIVMKNSSYIIIKDSSGKKYSTKSSYVECDDDECEVYLSKALKYGKSYQYEIHNIKPAGGKYTSLKGSFTAR